MSRQMTLQDLNNLVVYLEWSVAYDFRQRPAGPTWHCDGTFNLTKDWLKRNEIDESSAMKMLARHEVACDCQVISNYARMASKDDWVPHLLHRLHEWQRNWSQANNEDLGM